MNARNAKFKGNMMSDLKMVIIAHSREEDVPLTMPTTGSSPAWVSCIPWMEGEKYNLVK